MWTLRVFVTPHGYSGALRGDALAYMYGRKKYVQNLPPVGCRHSSNQQQAHQISPQTLIRTGGYKNTCVCTPPTVCTNTRGGGMGAGQAEGGWTAGRIRTSCDRIPYTTGFFCRSDVALFVGVRHAPKVYLLVRMSFYTTLLFFL